MPKERSLPTRIRPLDIPGCTSIVCVRSKRGSGGDNYILESRIRQRAVKALTDGGMFPGQVDSIINAMFGE